jgi:hypothetical protein
MGERLFIIYHFNIASTKLFGRPPESQQEGSMDPIPGLLQVAHTRTD